MVDKKELTRKQIHAQGAALKTKAVETKKAADEAMEAARIAAESKSAEADALMAKAVDLQAEAEAAQATFSFVDNGINGKSDEKSKAEQLKEQQRLLEETEQEIELEKTKALQQQKLVELERIKSLVLSEELSSPQSSSPSKSKPTSQTKPDSSAKSSNSQDTVDIVEIDYNEIKNLKDNLSAKSSRTTSSLDENTCNRIILAVKNKKSLANVTQAMILIAGLMQNGGSNQNANTVATYYALGKELSATELSSIVKSISPKGTLRQFARGIGTQIALTAIIIHEEGDLAKTMRREDPSITEDEACWCSNFQTGNPNCPQKVAKWLAGNYEKRFNK